MKERLLILTNSSSGLYDFRKELIIRLSERYDISVAVPETDKTEELKKIGCTINIISMDRRGINPIKDMALMRKYSKLIKKVKPDFVITYTIKPNIYGNIICRLKKIPCAANITGLGTTFQKDNFLQKLVVKMYKFSLKETKDVFFENEENKNIFLNKGIISDSQAYLLNGAGVNLEHFYFCDYPTESSTIHFLFVGRIMKEKGVDELFYSMNKLNEEGYHCDLSVLGNYEEDYKDIIDEYSSKGWLKYYGYQPDVRPFIEKSHCFILPSWHEGMANTNLECAAMGRPLITSNISGCKEAVIEGVSGFLCNKNDKEDLLSVMRKFINLNASKRKNMGIESRKHIVEVFDKNEVVNATVSRLYVKR